MSPGLFAGEVVVEVVYINKWKKVEKKPSEGVVWSECDFTWANTVQGKEQWILSLVKLECEDWKISRTLLSTQSALLRNVKSKRGEKKSVSTPVSAEMEGTAHFSSASSREDNLASSDEQILLKTRCFSACVIE